MRKPGAFARYRYREELFPSPVFRQAYDRLLTAHAQRQADVEYLRVLHLAASTMESGVEAALKQVLSEEQVPTFDRVRPLVETGKPEVPRVEVARVDLAEYDSLLAQGVAS